MHVRDPRAQRFCSCFLLLASVQIPLARTLPALVQFVVLAHTMAGCVRTQHHARCSVPRAGGRALACTPVAEIGSHMPLRRLLAPPPLLGQLPRDLVALLSREDSRSMAQFTRSFF